MLPFPVAGLRRRETPCPPRRYTPDMETESAGRRAPAARLVCDVMLGRLARWLRALGHDAAYDHAADDAELVRRAARERRVLVTRDTRIVAPPGVRLVLLRSNGTPGQLRELVGALGIVRHPGLLSRCLVCNTRLRAATLDEIEARAPDHVRATQRDFLACPGCGRVYWSGTHQRKLTAALRLALRDERAHEGNSRAAQEGPDARRTNPVE